MLRLLDHAAVLGFLEEGRHLAQQPSRHILFLLAAPNQLLQMPQPKLCPPIAGFSLRQLHIFDEDDLLLQVIEGDDLVKEHEIHILEAFRVLRVQTKRGFIILQVIIGEVAHQAAGEGRKPRHLRTPILFQNLPNVVVRMLRFYGQRSGLQLSVLTGDFQLRVKTQEGIAAPALPILHRFQQKYMIRNILQHLQHRNGCGEVREKASRHRQNLIFSGFCIFHCLFKGGIAHVLLLSPNVMVIQHPIATSLRDARLSGSKALRALAATRKTSKSSR